MTDDGEICPPEGKTSFSGIPESQFIVDVEAFMKVWTSSFLDPS